MEIYRFLLVSDPRKATLFVVLAIAGGILQSIAAYMIGRGAEQLRFGQAPGLDGLGLFVIVLILLSVALYKAAVTGLAIAEQSVGRMAIRLAACVRDTQLAQLERLGAEPILSAIALDTTTIANAGTTAVNAVISATAVAGTMMVLLLATPDFFLAWLPFILLIALILRAADPGIRRAAAKADTAEKAFSAVVTHALEGFKELRLDPAKMHSLSGQFAFDSASAVLNERVKAGAQQSARVTSIFVLRFVMMGVITFVLPSYGFADGMTVALIVAAASVQAMLEIAAYQPLLVTCNVSIQRLQALEAELRRFQEPGDSHAGVQRTGFSTIQFEDVSFSYTGQRGEKLFSVGPFNVKLNAGEILFVAGGNGSGKSTFLKLLTGLYPPESGVVSVDQRPIGLASYRSLFSTVFSDFHLFDRLYGIPPADPTRVEGLLRQLQMHHKAALVDGAFTTTKLSTGQRKRLALIAAVLEDRPIIVFDEWTADQDPEFRDTFYKDLLPHLRREGKTVVAVTHDDRYFTFCDRLLTLSDGQIIGDQEFSGG